jgi:hypothetical protein
VHYGTSASYFAPNEHLKAQAAVVAKQPCKQSPVSQVDKKSNRLLFGMLMQLNHTTYIKSASLKHCMIYRNLAVI